MRYELDSNRFLVGNNCTVGFLYRDVFKKQYETPFVWNWFSYDDFTRLTLYWNEINWREQDFTVRRMAGEDLRRKNGFKLQPSANNDFWMTMRLVSESGQEFFTMFTHWFGMGQGMPQIERRRVRMIDAIEKGKKPLFIFARDCAENHFSTQHLDIAANNDDIVFCDHEGVCRETEWIAHNVALPNLIERGYVKAVEE